jgi:hypothetical protein
VGDRCQEQLLPIGQFDAKASDLRIRSGQHPTQTAGPGAGTGVDQAGPPVVSSVKTTIRLVRVQEGLSLWWLGTAAMAAARVEPGEAEVGLALVARG